jgi:uncharacterized protein with PQ loop repeat
METSTSMNKQRIYTHNIAVLMTALASLMAIPITKKRMNKDNNAMFMFLFLVVGISLFSLSLTTTMINAQASSGSTSDGSSGSSGPGIHMGICVVGIRSPCNGDSN